MLFQDIEIIRARKDCKTVVLLRFGQGCGIFLIPMGACKVVLVYEVSLLYY